MSEPLFSIITISFNSEKTIERTIKSVLEQTYKDLEYIIVDGCSKDRTLDIVKKYEPLFEGRMKWKSEPDKGIYDAMNKGIRMATGDIIGIVNSDDWLESGAVEVVANAFVQNGKDTNALYCGGINYHRTDGTIKRWDANIKSFKRQAILYIMSGIRHPATFVPRQVYDKMGMFDDQMKLSADQDFILRCHFCGVQFIEIKQTLSNMSEGGISTEGTIKARKISETDRRIMLQHFGKKGLSFYWLWYTWKFRGFVGRHLWETKRLIVSWLCQLKSF